MKSRSNAVLLALFATLALLLGGALIVAAGSDAAPAQQSGLVITIAKAVDPTEVGVNETISYTVSLHNDSPQMVSGVVATDALPSLVMYEPGSASATSGVVTVDGNYITWVGDVPGGAEVQIYFRAKIGPQVACKTIIINHAFVRVGTLVGQSPPAAIQVICPDLGDAPDNTNHFGVSMTAYPPGGPLGIAARYPTVYGGPPGSVRGPYHRFSRSDSWLGHNVSGEADADLFWDNDGMRNIEPPPDVPNHDGFDDGVLGGALVDCQSSNFNYTVTIVGPAATRYFNAWFDYNQDGDWEDVIPCADGTAATEWAVQNQTIGFGPGFYTITTPAFTPSLPAAVNKMWMRMTLTRNEQPPINPFTSIPDGRGPDAGYVYGETEDYFFINEQQGEPHLQAVKTVNTNLTTPGSTLTYSIVISNTGNAPANGVQFQDLIPAGTTYVGGSATATSGSVSYGGGMVQWNGNIPPGGSVTITFQVTVNANFQCPGTVQNVGTVLFNGQVLSTNPVYTEIWCPPPQITIQKVVNPTHASVGDTLMYTITINNPTTTNIVGATAEDQIPAGTSYVPSSAWASSGSATYVPNKVVWTGNVPAGGSVTFGFSVLVGSTATPQECGGRIENKAELHLNGAIIASNPAHTQIMCPDLGDAPDSSNHFPNTMQAYSSGVLGRFPTVFDAATGLPEGPKHWLPRADAWLGQWVSGERDADLTPDEDVRPNLEPPLNRPDQDRFDDGIVMPISLLSCQPNTFNFMVSAQPGAARSRIANVWFDYNQDGDWEDSFQCANGMLAQEWAVQNQAVPIPASGAFASLPFATTPYFAWTPMANTKLWMRITLSDMPAPTIIGGPADGRGPAAGYHFGETEDYFLPGRPGEPPHLSLRKSADVQHGWIGDTITYSITVKNLSNVPANGLVVQDPIPAGTVYVSGSVSSTVPTATFTGTAIQWTGNLPPMGQVTIRFKVTVVGNPVVPPECNQKITNRATLTSPDGVTLTSNPVHFFLICPDLGDAPDTTNHFGAAMTAYPAVPANYPTVFDPGTGAVQGPRHRLPKADAFLGRGVTGERDADLMPDQDGLTNLDPPANVANRDRMDDGLVRPLLLPNCQPTRISYVVTVVGPARARYVNVWFDWNRDGDWEDLFQCAGMAVTADEWAVKNQVIASGPGVYTITSPLFLPFNANPNQSLWLRVTLSEVPAPINPVTLRPDGRGPAGGYRFGETEDYFNGDGNGNPDVWVIKTLRRIEPVEASVPGQPGGGWRALWHMDYGNSGTATANNVGVTDVFPTGMSYASSSSNPNHEPPAVGGTSATWSIGTLAPGDNGFIDLWLYAPATSMPSGTIITNTATISTTTPGDDPTNNTSSASGIIPLMPPRITWPLAGTTCSGNITVTGTSALGTVVDVYVDGGLVGTATTDGSGNWSLPVTGLTDGAHAIYAVARLGANTSPPSPTVVVIVDSTLTWDPLSLTFTAYYGGSPYVQHIMNGSGRADPTGWTVRLRPPFTYTVDVHVCCDDPATAQVTLTVGITPYVMSHIGGGWFQTVIPGVTNPSVPMSLACTCDGTTTTGDGTGLIDPDGYVFDVDTGVDKTDPIVNLLGRTVTALEEDDSSNWNRWPAELYEAQINPQVTGVDGYYSFFTPPGNYRITVAGDALYQPYRSWTLTVVDTPQHLDVPLTKVSASAQAAVSVDASGFQPSAIQVWQGATVSWQNTELTDGDFHSATSDLDARANTWGFDSGLLDRDQTYQRQFNNIGMFTYFDVENTGATGSVQVCKRTDVNCSNTVDVLDLSAAAAAWHNAYDSLYDINDDGSISIADIQMIAADFGWAF